LQLAVREQRPYQKADSSGERYESQDGFKSLVRFVKRITIIVVRFPQARKAAQQAPESDE